MYRRPKFLELLLEIRQDMALEADHDVDQFVQSLRGDADPREVELPAAAAQTDDTRQNISEITKAAVSGRKR